MRSGAATMSNSRSAALFSSQCREFDSPGPTHCTCSPQRRPAKPVGGLASDSLQASRNRQIQVSVTSASSTLP